MDKDEDLEVRGVVRDIPGRTRKETGGEAGGEVGGEGVTRDRCD